MDQQRLRALDALAEDPGSFSSTHGGSQPSVTPVSGDLTLFWPPQVPGTHVAYIHTCRQDTHTHKLKRIARNRVEPKQ